MLSVIELFELLLLLYDINCLTIYFKVETPPAGETKPITTEYTAVPEEIEPVENPGRVERPFDDDSESGSEITHHEIEPFENMCKVEKRPDDAGSVMSMIPPKKGLRKRFLAKLLTLLHVGGLTIDS